MLPYPIKVLASSNNSKASPKWLLF